MEANFKVIDLVFQRCDPLVTEFLPNLYFVNPFSTVKNLSRGLVNIAAKLTNTKDVRDFFIDLVEKVRTFTTFGG